MIARRTETKAAFAGLVSDTMLLQMTFGSDPSNDGNPELSTCSERLPVVLRTLPAESDRSVVYAVTEAKLLCILK